MKLKYITYFALSLLFSTPVKLTAHKLESTLLSMVDGSVINGVAYHEMQQFRLDIHRMLHGRLQPNKTRVGAYPYQGQAYSVAELARMEYENGSNPTLETCFKSMLDDFIRIAHPFKERINRAKDFLQTLIIQSCQFRSRQESLLVVWADPHAKDEQELFDRHVKSIHTLATLLRDLVDFLSDLMESCPIAKKQYVTLLQKKAEQTKQ